MLLLLLIHYLCNAIIVSQLSAQSMVISIYGAQYNDMILLINMAYCISCMRPVNAELGFH